MTTLRAHLVLFAAAGLPAAATAANGGVVSASRMIADMIDGPQLGVNFTPLSGSQTVVTGLVGRTSVPRTGLAGFASMRNVGATSRACSLVPRTTPSGAKAPRERHSCRAPLIRA